PAVRVSISSCLLVALIGGCQVPGGAERGGWVEPDMALFENGPYLLLGAPGVARVTLKDSRISAPTVEWWVVPAHGDGAAAGGEPEVHQVTAVRHESVWVATLEGLPVGPSIGYRVRSTRGTTP